MRKNPRGWIQIGESRTRGVARFSRHLSAGFTDLNPAPRGLSLYNIIIEWQLAYMFSLVYFSVEVCLVGVFPHFINTRRDPCVRVYAPLTLASPLARKQNSNRGWPGSIWSKRGGIWTDVWVCLHYWVEIWVAGLFNFHLYSTVYGVWHRQNTSWP